MIQGCDPLYVNQCVEVLEVGWEPLELIAVLSLIMTSSVV
jgi:hypothetical protein